MSRFVSLDRDCTQWARAVSSAGGRVSFRRLSGAWKIETGVNMKATAFGRFLMRFPAILTVAATQGGGWSPAALGSSLLAWWDAANLQAYLTRRV